MSCNRDHLDLERDCKDHIESAGYDNKCFHQTNKDDPNCIDNGSDYFHLASTRNEESVYYHMNVSRT